MSDDLVKGGRFRLSKEGYRMYKRHRSGVVLNPVSKRYTSCARVVFDGTKTPDTVHRSFLEPEES